MRVSRNSRARIDDRDLISTVALRHRDVDRSVLGRILDRVVQQVEEQTAEQIGVAFERRLRDMPARRNAALVGNLPNAARRVVDDLLQIVALDA